VNKRQFSLKNTLHLKNKGFLLVIMIVMITVISVVTIATSKLVVVNHKVANTSVYDTNAQFAADAAIDEALQRLSNNGSWPGTSGEVTLQNTGTAKVTYDTSVNAGSDSNTRIVTVTGRAYPSNSDTQPTATRKYTATVKSTVEKSLADGYSVATGPGGLSLGPSAEIRGGDIYVNGKINLGTSASIGTSSNPVNVRAAHQSCPSYGGNTYPEVCGAGNGQPISMGTSADIYGEVVANNQSSGAGMSRPGLVEGTVVPAVLPKHDRTSITSAITYTMSSSAASCGTSGSKTIPANTKIIGNLNLGTSCELTIGGNIWVTGNVNAGTSSEIRVQNGLTTPPVIMVDGSGGFTLGASASVVKNGYPNRVGARIITYWSAASCSPDCLDVTGTDLKNSQNRDTIYFESSATADASETYSRWSATTFSTSSTVGAAAGQQINIGTSGTVNFSKDVTFDQSSSSSESWSLVSYERKY
jgi:Tfp pilus assembly protein PilX